MVFGETDDSRFRLIGPEAIMVFGETDDSRFRLIGPEAIMVYWPKSEVSENVEATTIGGLPATCGCGSSM